VVSDRVFVGSADGNVYAVDAETGDVVWTFLTGSAVRSKPAVSEGVVYVGSWDKNFYAITAMTGEEIWQTPLNGQVQSTGFIANGMVYTASRKASVFALDLQTGEIRWERSFGNNIWIESSPHLVGDTIYIGSSGLLKVEAIDSMTGKPKSLFMSRTFNWSTPVVVEDMLYIGAVNFELPERSGLLAIPLVDGIFPTATQWTWLYPMQATLAAGGGWSGVSGSPVVVNGIIYFGGLDGILYALKI
jgi:eukaryotic-like serine/threonine-protein kinase